MPHTETTASTKTMTKLQEPPQFRVIYINDDTTSIDFVVSSLVHWFEYPVDLAEKISQDIHASGAAVVAVLPYEIAEQKGTEITISARSNGYPLQIKLEPDVN